MATRRVPAPTSGAIFTARPPAVRRRPRSLVDVTLDRSQKSAVERPAGESLLVLGEAGHGKTTVAMHRLAYLWGRSPVALRVAAVVPAEGLARLLQPLFRRLGVDVEVVTYDAWAAGQARRAFRRLPPESDSTPPAVAALKRHPALRVAIEHRAASAPGRIDDAADAPVWPRVGNVTRGDLQHLFGDRALLERVAAAGPLPARAVLDTLDRTRIQFSPTAEQEWADVVDRARLVAVDHRALDAGTASGAARTVDVEDYAVLFALDALRAARTGRRPASRRTYDVLFIDEAQELAPLELALLGQSLEPGGTLIVAGDAQQQTDDTTAFVGWSSAMRELGCRVYETVELEIGYRCPPDVAALARAIRAGEQAGPRTPTSTVRVFDDERSLDDWLARGLRDLGRRDPRASVAIVCRSPLVARRRAAGMLARELPARLVFDGRFVPRGVQVSTVDEVKGLEFDFVVVADAGARDYPGDPASRRALYAAVTRARHGLALATAGPPSPILAP
jgi:superfamily I DNA/RNA helicase